MENRKTCVCTDYRQIIYAIDMEQRKKYQI